ncbi:MAG: hypothetical protein JWL69_113 [Phycisphaerales bacterium]|nr:hypothetical protein [Phycisphaerales bacterium]
MRWITPLSLAAVAGLAAGCPSEYHHEERERVVVYDRPVYQPAPEYRERVVVEEPVVTEVVAGPEVEISEFHEQLSPYGEWITVEGLGECWAPSGVDPDWRPYTVGYFVHSRYGPTWVSEERWGWATYHYGRWAEIRGHRWVWVPGRTWGPAWVAWRSGDGYCGWAPLPPRGGERLVITAYDADDIPPDRFVFCQERYVYEPRVREHCEPVRNNVTIINRTTNITNITVVNNRVVSHGVDVHEVERASGHRINDVRVEQASSFTEFRSRHDEQWQRYHPQAAQHEALHEQHVAEHDALHQAHVDEHNALHQEHVDEHNALHQVHVDEHNANVAAHDAAHAQHVEQHDALHQTHVDEHNADVAAHDAAHAKHVEEHDVAHENRVTAEQAAQQKRLAEQKAAEDKHLAEQKAAEQKHAAEHDAHVEAHDATHEKHVAEQDAAKAKAAAEHDQRVAAENAARAKRAAEIEASKKRQVPSQDKQAADKNQQKDPKDKKANQDDR